MPPTLLPSYWHGIFGLIYLDRNGTGNRKSRNGTIYRLHWNWNLAMPPPPPPPLLCRPLSANLGWGAVTSLSRSWLNNQHPDRLKMLQSFQWKFDQTSSQSSNWCGIEIRLMILWENVNLIKQSRVRSAYRSNPLAGTLIQVAAIIRLWTGEDGECKLICAGG